MEMEVENEREPFTSIIKFCEPTASQEAKFPNCPLARESENFMDSNPDQFSSSPDLTPSNPTGIVMISPPGSSSSVDQHMLEEDAVFLTPPKHHSHSHLSSSEDQNPNELCAGAGDGEGSDRTTEVRVLDEPETKRVRVVPGVEFDDDTVPLGVTEIAEIEGDGVAKFDAISGNHAKTNKNSDSSESLDSGKIEDDIAKLKRIVGNGSLKVKLRIGGFEKASKISNDRHRDEGVSNIAKRIEEIEEFRYAGDVDGGCERTTVGRMRQLPPSLKGKEKGVDKKSGLFEMMDVLKGVFGDRDGGCEVVDYLETAKRRGLTFPKARWWPSDGDEK